MLWTLFVLRLIGDHGPARVATVMARGCLLEEGLLVDCQTGRLLVTWLVLNWVFSDPYLICWHDARASTVLMLKLMATLLILCTWVREALPTSWMLLAC